MPFNPYPRELELTASNWLTKSSLAPGYIIFWHPPASCGRTHLHQIQPRPQVKVIFRYPRSNAPASLSSAYLHRCISWLMARSRANMQHFFYLSYTRFLTAKHSSSSKQLFTKHSTTNTRHYKYKPTLYYG